MKFNQLKNFLEEKEKNKKELKKEISLLDHKIEVKILPSEEIGLEKYDLSIKSLKDPNIKGHIEYDSYDDAKIAFNSLDGVGVIVEFMHDNSKEYSSAYKWSKIVKDEIETQNLGGEKDKDKITVKIGLPAEEEPEEEIPEEPEEEPEEEEEIPGPEEEEEEEEEPKEE